MILIDRYHNKHHDHPKHYTIPYTVSSRNHVIRSEAHFPSPRSLQNLRFLSSSPPTPSSPLRFLLFHLSVCGFRSCAFSGVVLFRRSVLVRGSPFPLVSTPLSSSDLASIPHSPRNSNTLDPGASSNLQRLSHRSLCHGVVNRRVFRPGQLLRDVAPLHSAESLLPVAQFLRSPSFPWTGN